MTEEKKPSQDVVMYNRRRVELSGIEDVESFNDGEILLRYSEGAIALSGEEMKVELFSAETGRLTVTGVVSCLEYFGGSRGKMKKRGK